MAEDSDTTEKIDRRIGNEFWKARSSHGRDPIFKTDDELFSACEEYFQWVVDNPLGEAKLFSYEGKIITGELNKMRAMTLDGLCTFLDITKQTWYNYKEKNDFIDVMTRVEQVMRNQKFTGAAADLLNPNIIARDLGLAEKKEHSGPDGGPIQNKQTVVFNPVGPKSE